MSPEGFVFQHPWLSLGLVWLSFAMVIVVAVEFALWRRMSSIEGMFEKSLLHGSSFDLAASDIRKRAEEAERVASEFRDYRQGHAAEHVILGERLLKVEDVISRARFAVKPPEQGP